MYLLMPDTTFCLYSTQNVTFKNLNVCDIKSNLKENFTVSINKLSIQSKPRFERLILYSKTNRYCFTAYENY